MNIIVKNPGKIGRENFDLFHLNGFSFAGGEFSGNSKLVFDVLEDGTSVEFLNG